MQNFDLFHKKVARAKSIVITTHEYPDADGIVSQIALCLALRSMGKKTRGQPLFIWDHPVDCLLALPGRLSLTK